MEFIYPIYQKRILHTIILLFFVIVLVGCKGEESPSSTEVVMATPSPIVIVASPTPIVVIVTPTPVELTATATSPPVESPEMPTFVVATVTPDIILIASPTASPLPVFPTYTPTYTPIPVMPLSIPDCYAIRTGCSPGGGWFADLWVLPKGGDGNYTFYVEGVLAAGPAQGGVTLKLNSPGGTLVGRVTVESAGQIASREYFIQAPQSCGG